MGERRFSLPTGYRLLNDLSSLKRQGGQRVRKDNLVTRGGGSVKVRHVPILLEVEEKNGQEEEQEEKEKKELKRGTMMTPAPMMLQTNQHQASQKSRPPRFSLPSPSVTESAKVQNFQNEFTWFLLAWLDHTMPPSSQNTHTVGDNLTA